MMAREQKCQQLLQELQELHLFRTCRLRWGSKVSPTMDRPPGTLCNLPYECQSCHRMPSHVHWRRTCSRPPGTIETFLRASSAEYKCTDLLTYFLTCSDISIHAFIHSLTIVPVVSWEGPINCHIFYHAILMFERLKRSND